MAKKILIVAGEPSGDLHAANLVRDLKSLDPSLEFYGIGGDKSKAAGVDIVFDITRLALIGVIEVIRNLDVVKRAHDAVIARIDSDRPDLAILVDYPGFNLKLAGDLAKRSIPVAYYISPQIWAWGLERVHRIKRCVRKMVVFFGFEKELYAKYGVEAECVGHPLLDIVKVTATKDETLGKYGLSKDKRTIAILPGSRMNELKVFMPILTASAQLITGKLGNVQFVFSKRPDKSAELYEGVLKGSGLDYRIVEGDVHNIIAASDFVISSSGTVTLETTIIGTPYILMYKANLISYLLWNVVVINRFFGLANIIAGREIVPEFLQYRATPQNIGGKAVELLSDPAKLAAMRKELFAVTATLGAPGASLRAARAILPLLT